MCFYIITYDPIIDYGIATIAAIFQIGSFYAILDGYKLYKVILCFSCCSVIILVAVVFVCTIRYSSVVALCVAKTVVLWWASVVILLYTVHTVVKGRN